MRPTLRYFRNRALSGQAAFVLGLAVAFGLGAFIGHFWTRLNYDGEPVVVTRALGARSTGPAAPGLTTAPDCTTLFREGAAGKIVFRKGTHCYVSFTFIIEDHHLRPSH
jgi:hypothetical protein